MDRETARELLARLNRDAERIAHRFELRYQAIEAERPQVKRRFGICYSDGRIFIRLRHVTTGRALRYSSLVNTLCHELAHLRHMNHGPRFKAFYFRILAWARSEGIYQPGAVEVVEAAVPSTQAGRRSSAPPVPPAQLTLF